MIDWDLAKGKLPPRDILLLFGPRLSRNQFDIPVLYEILMKEPTSVLLNEIHEHRVDPYLDWEKHDLVCPRCMKTLIEKHLQQWAVRRLREGKSDVRFSFPGRRLTVCACSPAGRHDREDCWYGHQCRTQTHKVEHALRLNVS